MCTGVPPWLTLAFGRFSCRRSMIQFCRYPPSNSPSPFSDANKLIKFLILRAVVELLSPPKYVLKSTYLQSCLTIVFLTYFSQFFCSGRRIFRLSFALLLRKNGAQLEKIDSVLYYCFSFGYRLVELKYERLCKVDFCPTVACPENAARMTRTRKCL